MIVVTGASGQLGRLAIEALLRSVPASGIVAAVRNPAKVADLAARGVVVRQADYADAAAWDAALQGARKVLLVSSSEVGQRTAQHRTVIDAARRAGVELLAYTSVLHADTSALELAREHVETEALLKASGVPHVLLRNGWYTENYLAGVGPALQHGALFGAAGEGRIASAARADYAEAAAAVLTAPDQAGRVHELAGDTAYTLADLAAEIARVAGKPVPYRNLPEADYAQALQGAGLPPHFAALLAQSDAAAAQGALYDGSGQLGRLIGRPTTPWQAQAADAVRAAG
ncbi:SDR family oxidoreductase [Acidovorax sp. NCPPB 4044]|uniref:SDR family oxidoreductase n=1 Tax=Acidovorax sp. NCPPB 4044 TaxID=2940490 RepID=UPI0023043B83|nr:SDR family oxidoreductase [Acidovorax sp. NCPPB 4044]MDA8519811.1 SDR family oxidoreductase [Acidovorax sp. NCPPB 4044]